MRLAVTLLIATLAVACQTADVGTSKVTTSGEPSEPTGKEPVATAQPAQPDKPRDTTGLEQNTARPGSDYREVALDAADPVACRDICNKQMRCMAFTYVEPNDDHGPLCRLKHSIPDKVEGEDCCVSGVNPRAEKRLAQLESQGFELDTDRPGSNFRSFEMSRPEPATCQEACENLIDCKAFTYMRPGYKGDKAYCYLKDDVPDKIEDMDCCVSGVKQTR